MQPPHDALHRPRSRPGLSGTSRLGVVLVGAAVLGLGLLALVALVRGSWSQRAAAGPGSPALAPELAAEGLEPEPLAPLAPPVRPQARADATSGSPGSAEPTRSLLVLERSSGAPAVGVSLWRGQATIAGPSDADGRIAIPADGRGAFVAWGPGFGAERVPAGRPPAEVRLDRAEATLRIRLTGLEPGDSIQRSLLQPTGRPGGSDSPWSPALVEVGFGELEARDLCPGTWTFYAWVDRADGEVVPVEGGPVELGPAAREELLLAVPLFVPEPDG